MAAIFSSSGRSLKVSQKRQLFTESMKSGSTGPTSEHGVFQSGQQPRLGCLIGQRSSPATAGGATLPGKDENLCLGHGRFTRAAGYPMLSKIGPPADAAKHCADGRATQIRRMQATQTELFENATRFPAGFRYHAE